jgi:hypothetical protein
MPRAKAIPARITKWNMLKCRIYVYITLCSFETKYSIRAEANVVENILLDVVIQLLSA